MSDVIKAVNEWVGGKYIFPLSAPIPRPEGGDLTELTLREPEGSDMIEAGNPVTFNPLNDDDPYRIDERKMGAMISRLAAMPPSVIGKMKPRDMLALSHVIGPFFLPF
jgi:hypothetical protein